MFHVEHLPKKPSESEDVNPTPPVRFAHGLSSAGQQQL